eukprot:1158475-Pelagomonas_calceolata.AAC.5
MGRIGMGPCKLLTKTSTVAWAHGHAQKTCSRAAELTATAVCHLQTQAEPLAQSGKSKPVPGPFTLQSQITKEELQGSKQRDWLHSKVLDKSSFNECIKSLSNNKSPGPDGIVNEILRMLPHEIQ